MRIASQTDSILYRDIFFLPFFSFLPFFGCLLLNSKMLRYKWWARTQSKLERALTQWITMLVWTKGNGAYAVVPTLLATACIYYTYLTFIRRPIPCAHFVAALARTQTKWKRESDWGRFRKYILLCNAGRNLFSSMTKIMRNVSRRTNEKRTTRWI